MENGCLVVFGAEQKNRWRLAYAFINEDSSGKPACCFIESGGVANISPALAVIGNRACVVWESNASGRRAIMACWLEKSGPGKVEQISNTDINSYNPSIVAHKDGSAFAAWDSARNKSIDIYGARWRNGKWNRPRRLTSDCRIERYPSLASWKNQIWIAWQAQSYKQISVNNISEHTRYPLPHRPPISRTARRLETNPLDLRRKKMAWTYAYFAPYRKMAAHTHGLD